MGIEDKLNNDEDDDKNDIDDDEKYANIADHAGTLNLQDQKMTDQKRSKAGKCSTWKYKLQRWKMQDLENDAPNRRTGKCRTHKMKNLGIFIFKI